MLNEIGAIAGAAIGAEMILVAIGWAIGAEIIGVEIAGAAKVVIGAAIGAEMIGVEIAGAAYEIGEIPQPQDIFEFVF